MINITQIVVPKSLNPPERSFEGKFKVSVWRLMKILFKKLHSLEVIIF